MTTTTTTNTTAVQQTVYLVIYRMGKSGIVFER